MYTLEPPSSRGKAQIYIRKIFLYIQIAPPGVRSPAVRAYDGGKRGERMRRWIFPLLLLLAAPASASDVEERNKALAKRVFEEVLAGGNWELGAQVYAPDFVNRGLSRDASLKEDNDAAKGWQQAFPDLKMDVQQVIAEGDLVSVLWVATGTNTGSGNGLPATGKPARMRGITIWRIVNGRIAEEWSAFDQLSILQQLGLLPARD